MEDILKFESGLITKTFSEFKGKKVLIVGDVMLDAYWWGSVNRISPEAPVPIVAVKDKEFRLGGAANVALNLRALGAEPQLLTVVGEDAEANEFSAILQEHDISPDHLIRTDSRPTTVKTRVIGNKYQMLRIDHELTKPIDTSTSRRLNKGFKSLINDADILLFQDYDKGVLFKENIRKLLNIASDLGKPIVVDPKKRNFMHYKGATMFKPNLNELQSGLKIELPTKFNEQDLHKAAIMLIDKLNLDIAFITLSEKGVFIANKDEHYQTPAHVRSIYDVSGAGDTVVSVASLALSTGADEKLIAEISNIAGGLVCEKVGVVPIDKDQLYRESMRLLSE